MRLPLTATLIQCTRNAAAANIQCMSSRIEPASRVGTSGASPLIARLMMDPIMIATITSKALGVDSSRRLPSRTRTSVMP
jgi:hypothetical protein